MSDVAARTPGTVHPDSFTAAFSAFARKNVAVMVSLFVLTAITFAAFLGPLAVFRYNGCSYSTQDLSVRLQPPSLIHPFGTDFLGRDLLARLLFGTRISLAIGLMATLLAVPVGVTYGLFSGYVGGRIDNVMMRIIEVLASLPELIFVAMLLSLFERSLFLLAAALASISWLTMARVVRGQVLSLKNEAFVEAARSMRLSTPALLFRHILPNIAGPVVVYALLTFPSVILSEAFLSFLGVGVAPPVSSLGVLVQEGADAMTIAPFLLVTPAATMAIIILALSILGDRVRSAMDPRS